MTKYGRYVTFCHPEIRPFDNGVRGEGASRPLPSKSVPLPELYGRKKKLSHLLTIEAMAERINIIGVAFPGIHGQHPRPFIVADRNL